MDDSLDSIDVSAYGNPGLILYTFKVWDHRTEGRIHINKRDLELYKADMDSSFGQTQGMRPWKEPYMACLQPRTSYIRMESRESFIIKTI